MKCRSADLGFAFRLSSRLFGNSTRKSVCFHCGRRRFHRGICPSQTRLCALRENIHASALLCEEPLRPLRLNFKSHKVQETFTAEDAEDFAEGAEEHYGRKEFHHGICPSQTCWDAFARNRLPLLVFIQNRIISSGGITLSGCGKSSL